MSTAYTVLPMAADYIAWLESEKVDIPPISEPARFPTLAELKQTLALLSGFQVQYGEADSENPWPVLIDRTDEPGGDKQTVLKITACEGDDVPHGFWFEKAWPPLAVAVVQRLAAFCGPLVLLSTSDGAPLVVQSTSDVGELLKTWRHTAGQSSAV